MKCMTNKKTEGGDPAWRESNQDLLCLIVFVTSIRALPYDFQPQDVSNSLDIDQLSY